MSGKPFEAGRVKTGGRVKGSRNRIAFKFIESLADDFEQHGIDAIKICRVERPSEYLKIIASLLPREFEITETVLMQMPDEEINELRDELRRRIAERRAALSIAGNGDSPTTH